MLGNEGSRRRRSRTVSGLESRRLRYAAVLLVGRVADSATTAYGLTLPGVYERNPAVAWLMDALGAGGGLLVANLLSVGAVVLAAEAGARACRHDGLDDRHVTLVRGACYLSFGLASLAVAAHNVAVIASV